MRNYRPSDDAACQLLEQRADQFRQFKWRQRIPFLGTCMDFLLQVHQVHPRGFDSRANTVPERELLVCQDVENGRLVAVICCHIREAIWHKNDRIRIGWVYGLRVDKDYQRRGIARALSTELEDRCRERGVSLLYLTVNRENLKARARYETFGWKTASERQPVAKILIKQNEVSASSFRVIRLEKKQETVASLTARYQGEKDLSLTNWKELFALEDYQSTFIAVDTAILPAEFESFDWSSDPVTIEARVLESIRSDEISNYAGISLWNSSSSKSFQVDRLFVAATTWLMPWFRNSLYFAILLLVLLWGSSTFWRIGEHVQQNEATSLAWKSMRVFEVFIQLGLLSLLVLFRRFVEFLVSRDSSHLTARAFAPFCHGPTGKECLRKAIESSQDFALSRGFALWIWNIPRDYPFADIVPKPAFGTLFLQKWVCEDRPQEWKIFSSETFCDPRDL